MGAQSRHQRRDFDALKPNIEIARQPRRQRTVKVKAPEIPKF
jgi:hypothetical protein